MPNRSFVVVVFAWRSLVTLHCHLNVLYLFKECLSMSLVSVLLLVTVFTLSLQRAAQHERSIPELLTVDFLSELSRFQSFLKSTLSVVSRKECYSLTFHLIFHQQSMINNDWPSGYQPISPILISESRSIPVCRQETVRHTQTYNNLSFCFW